jgi:hypothetical protein
MSWSFRTSEAAMKVASKFQEAAANLTRNEFFNEQLRHVIGDQYPDATMSEFFWDTDFEYFIRVSLTERVQIRCWKTVTEYWSFDIDGTSVNMEDHLSVFERAYHAIQELTYRDRLHSPNQYTYWRKSWIAACDALTTKYMFRTSHEATEAANKILSEAAALDCAAVYAPALRELWPWATVLEYKWKNKFKYDMYVQFDRHRTARFMKSYNVEICVKYLDGVHVSDEHADAWQFTELVRVMDTFTSMDVKPTREAYAWYWRKDWIAACVAL